MSLSGRRGDDADVIRARLRRLLADAEDVAGWVPEDDEPVTDAGAERWTQRPGPAPGPHGEDDAGPSAGGSAAAEHGSTALPDGIGRHRSPGPGVRWSPGRPGARAIWLAGVAAALLLVAWTWLDRPQVEPAPAPIPASSPAEPDAAPASSPPVPAGQASDAPASVVVSVVGLVVRPGLVTLPAGARVADAVEAAGGLLPEADPASVNQAAVVTDGQQIAVGVPGAPPPPAGSEPAGSGGPVDLNTATVAQLDALPGIGPVLAQRIVDHRTEVGPFGSVEELDDVPGIGPTTAADLADLVTV